MRSGFLNIDALHISIMQYRIVHDSRWLEVEVKDEDASVGVVPYVRSSSVALAVLWLSIPADDSTGLFGVSVGDHRVRFPFLMRPSYTIRPNCQLKV